MKLLSILLSFAVSTAALAKPEKMMLDTTSSKINWKGSKEFVNDFHTGTVAIKSGYVEMDKDAIVGGEVVIDMTKIENTDLTDAASKTKLVGHLQSADFFDTQKFQTAVFKIKKATKKADAYVLDGDLTIKGQTNPFQITNKIVKENNTYAAKGAASIDRTQFGVKYNSQSFFPDLIKTGKDKVIKNNMDLEFDLRTLARK